MRRERLVGLDGLRAATAAGMSALAGDDGDSPGASEQLASAAARLDGLAGVDPSLDALSARLRALVLDAADLATELRRYGDGLEDEPGALAGVEERLEALERLIRKHGGSIASVTDHAERCRARRDELMGAGVAFDATSSELEVARAGLEAVVTALREARAGAAGKLAAAVRSRLAELAMPEATFEVRLSERPGDPPGPTPSSSRSLPIRASPPALCARSPRAVSCLA